MAQIRTEWLKTFLAAVDTGSFTAAADRVHRSQSAVSLQVAQLEGALGHRLLARGPQGLQTLPAGEHLLPYARQAVNAADAAANAFVLARAKPLRLGLPEEYADGALPHVIAEFSDEHPETQLEVTCAASSVLESYFHTAAIDIALGLQEEITSLGDPVLSDPTFWVEGAQTHLMQRYAHLPVVLFDTDCIWRRWALEALEREAIRYRIVFSSSSVAALRAAIRAGIGVGLMGASTLTHDLRPFKPLEHLPSPPPSTLVLLKRQSVDIQTATTLKYVISNALARR